MKLLIDHWSNINHQIMTFPKSLTIIIQNKIGKWGNATMKKMKTKKVEMLLILNNK